MLFDSFTRMFPRMLHVHNWPITSYDVSFLTCVGEQQMIHIAGNSFVSFSDNLMLKQNKTKTKAKQKNKNKTKQKRNCKTKKTKQTSKKSKTKQTKQKTKENNTRTKLIAKIVQNSLNQKANK